MGNYRPINGYVDTHILPVVFTVFVYTTVMGNYRPINGYLTHIFSPFLPVVFYGNG